MKKIICKILALGILSSNALAQVSITGDYTQTFDSIGTGLPSGWTVRTGASASSLGTAGAFTATAATWGDTAGSFKNVASTDGLNSGSSTANQGASTDRALGVRQSGSFGDPGASFAFNINTTGATISQISLKALLLNVQTRSTTWTIQYGIGVSPTSFTTLGTFADPGAWGATTLTYTTANFGTDLNNQSSVWIRISALGASTGTNSRDMFAIDDFSIAAVPEPHQYGLAFAGLFLALIVFRRRGQQQNS